MLSTLCLEKNQGDSQQCSTLNLLLDSFFIKQLYSTDIERISVSQILFNSRPTTHFDKIVYFPDIERITMNLNSFQIQPNLGVILIKQFKQSSTIESTKSKKSKILSIQSRRRLAFPPMSIQLPHFSDTSVLKHKNVSQFFQINQGTS